MQQVEEGIVELALIDDDDRLGEESEPLRCDRLEEFLESPGAARQGHDRVRHLKHLAFSLLHVFDESKLRQSGMGPFEFAHEARNHARAPIEPTAPPPYTRVLPARAIIAPSSAAASWKIGSQERLEAQNTSTVRPTLSSLFIMGRHGLILHLSIPGPGTPHHRRGRVDAIGLRS